MKKQLKLFIPSLLLSAVSVADAPQAQFISSVQMAVMEKSPDLTARSQKLVLEEFGRTFALQPAFRGKRFEMKTAGNQVAFFLTTESDMRGPMQAVVAHMVDQLNGRVYAKGRSAFYKTAYAQPFGGFLEVSVDDTHTKILSIAAQSIPLRDLLKEIKSQMGSFSYLVPGECADKEVDWSLGDPEKQPDGIPMDVAMNQLATVFGMTVEKRNGTYIFAGTCQQLHRTNLQNAARTELLRNSFFPNGAGALPIAHRQVFVPLLPIGE
jgi:hypothetical protein